MGMATNEIKPQDGASELRHPTIYKFCKIIREHLKLSEINVYAYQIINIVILNLILLSIY